MENDEYKFISLKEGIYDECQNGKRENP